MIFEKKKGKLFFHFVKDFRKTQKHIESSGKNDNTSKKQKIKKVIVALDRM